MLLVLENFNVKTEPIGIAILTTTWNKTTICLYMHGCVQTLALMRVGLGVGSTRLDLPEGAGSKKVQKQIN